TLDYRGIGESAPASLKGFAMSYLDWAYRDLAAAVELLGREERPLYWIGHSFGGHAIGLLPDHGRLAACYSFGSGADWSGCISRRETHKVRLMWALVLPPLVAWKGHMAWGLLGNGDDVPVEVYHDCRRGCRHPRYYLDDPAMGNLHPRYHVK
ncbi:alpha/beta fold hydrolase, partial [Pseudomonas aeruginosa]